MDAAKNKKIEARMLAKINCCANVRKFPAGMAPFIPGTLLRTVPYRQGQKCGAIFFEMAIFPIGQAIFNVHVS